MGEEKAVAYYLRNDVHGWLDPVAAEATILLLRSLDATGRPVAEIGVHHGRYIIFLALLTGGRMAGFDLFESRQSENVDGSGSGARAIFLSHARRCGIAEDRCVAVTANSLELDGAKVIESCAGRPVFFSVDGGHTLDLTVNDMRIAEASIAEDGIVALDDVFNPRWPSVAMGLAEYLRQPTPVLVPCAIAGGKVFLARGEDQARRHALALEGNHRTDIDHILRVDAVRLMNWPVTVLTSRVRTESFREGVTSTPQWMALRQSPLVAPLRRWARRLIP